jgi:hypothetical protein
MAAPAGSSSSALSSEIASRDRGRDSKSRHHRWNRGNGLRVRCYRRYYLVGGPEAKNAHTKQRGPYKT